MLPFQSPPYLLLPRRLRHPPAPPPSGSTRPPRLRCRIRRSTPPPLSKRPSLGLRAAGSGYTFPLYSPPLKAALGVDQRRLAMLGVASDIGENVGLLAGIACNRLAMLDVASDIGEDVGLLAGIACNHLAPWLILLVGSAAAFVSFGVIWLAVIRRIVSIPYWLVANALYYNAPLTLGILQNLGVATNLFNLWFQMLHEVKKSGVRANFKREHDKKVCLLGLTSLLTLPSSQLPADSLERVFKAILELLVSYKEQVAEASKEDKNNDNEMDGFNTDEDEDDGEEDEMGLDEEDGDQADNKNLQKLAAQGPDFFDTFGETPAIVFSSVIDHTFSNIDGGHTGGVEDVGLHGL